MDVGQGLRGSVLGLVIPAAEGEGIAVLDALPELGACGRGLQRDERGDNPANRGTPCSETPLPRTMGTFDLTSPWVPYT